MSEAAATPKPSSDFEKELARLRGEIDALDEQLIDLLKRRSTFVKEVGQIKHEHFPGRCPVRPGREAQQVRRVSEAMKGSLFEPAAAAAMWRMIIMSSLRLEGDIKVSVCASAEHPEVQWLAREYFAPFTTYIKQPTPKRAIGDVLDDKASIGVLPWFDTQDAGGHWWMDLLGSTKGERPKIFACLPFVLTGKPSLDRPLALAVGRIEPEETGDDLTYLALEADEMASMHRLQTAFSQAKLEVKWVDVLSPVPTRRHHLVEVKGFITEEHEQYKTFLASMQQASIKTTILGAVAAPVILSHE